MSNDTILKPDIVLTCGETNESYLTKAPEIIVEIISKFTARGFDKGRLGDSKIKGLFVKTNHARPNFV